MTSANWSPSPSALESWVLAVAGNPYIGKLRARRLLEQRLRVAVVDPTEVADDAFVASIGGMAYSGVAG